VGGPLGWRARDLAVASRRRGINHAPDSRRRSTGVVSSAGDNRCDNLINGGAVELKNAGQDGVSVTASCRR